MLTTATFPADSFSIDQALQQAVTRHKAGDLYGAEQLYRAILQVNPHHPEANHNLGVLAVQVQQPSVALPFLKVALEANPNHPQYWLSYIDTLIKAGQRDAARQVLVQGRERGLPGEALDALERQLAVAESNSVLPDTAVEPDQNGKGSTQLNRKQRRIAERTIKTATYNRSEYLPKGPKPEEMEQLVALFKQCRYTETEYLAREMMKRFPDHGFGWKVLGTVYVQQGNASEALMPMQKAAALTPMDAEVHSNLGTILMDLGCLEDAEKSYRRAVEIKPDYAKAHNNLGNALKDLGHLEEAEASYRKALEIKPDYAGVHNNLGNVLKDLGRLEEAEASYRKALQIKPDYAEVYSNLGTVLKDLGRFAEAEANYRKALRIKPDYAEAYSNLLFALNYMTHSIPSYRLKEACHYGQMVARKAGQHFSAWNCVPVPGRLRVGLVSGDLRVHPVGFFLENVLSHLDQSRIELMAYSTGTKMDELTARIKPSFSIWKSLVDKNDEVAANLIHEDGVHVLLDLSGHTANNRLPVFAWKPAPVQATWLGYFATTGVAEMDYIIGDPYNTPQEEEWHFTESIWRMPETSLCFTPPDIAVEVNQLPALSEGAVTFGCFNNFTKVNNAVVELWAKVLHATPGARLFLKAKQFCDSSRCKQVRDHFAEEGITPDRLLLEGFSSRIEYLKAYNRVDIALDPFPFPGGATSAESLWMGVPVLTKRGDRFISHQGETIMTNAGLADWIAVDDADYLDKARQHTADLKRLAALRGGLRQQVLASPLFDATRFAKNLEMVLWGMWEHRPR